ncbi:MAG TPA: hypothetical protein PLE48_16365, partial [Thiobacillus sp.]|nr:hypothetical protein [Thiobacillus sp.]
ADWRTSLPEWVAREAECAAAPIARQVWLRPFGLGAVGNLTPAADGWQWHILPHDARAHSATALLYLNHKAQI